jgi:hypothetical protein
LKDEKEGRAAEDTARDELVDQMMTASKALDTMRSSRRSSIASGMDWQSTLPRPASRLERSSDSSDAPQQPSPVRRTSRFLPSQRFSMESNMDLDLSNVPANSNELTPRGLGASHRTLTTPSSEVPAGSNDDQLSTTSREAPHANTSAAVYRSMLPVLSGQISRPGPSSNMSRSPLASFGGQQTISGGGFSLDNSSGFSSPSLGSSPYLSPYGQPSGSISTPSGTFNLQQQNQAIPGQPGSITQILPPGWSPQTQAHHMTARWSFLVNGSLATGQRTLTVNPEVMQIVRDQVRRWEGNPTHRNWNTPTRVSYKRCCDTRVVQRFSTRGNPPSSPNPNIACRNCVNKRALCILIESHGPVVVPLPAADRSPSATPLQGDFYVKTSVPSPVVSPLLPPLLPPPPPPQQF